MVAQQTVERNARRWLAGALDLLLPPRCLACLAPVDGHGRLCAACWARLDFIVAPRCAICGLPFDSDVGEAGECGVCMADPPAFDRARAVLRYNDIARSLVLGFKHGDRTQAAPVLAAWLARAGVDLLAEADAVTPVPLHRWRLWRRRYNQSALLAHALAAHAGLACEPDLLVRAKRTPSQGGLTRKQRFDNVRGAFVVRPGRVAAGRRLVLVDDVMTTGATARACARALKRAGAARVDVLALARVVGPGDRYYIEPQSPEDGSLQ